MMAPPVLHPKTSTPAPPAQASPSTSTDFFSTQADRWIQLYSAKTTFKDRLRLFINELTDALPNGGRVLDFGCGPGLMSLAFAELGYDVTGVDGAQGMAEAAERERRRRGILNAQFRRMDARAIDLPAASFDAIVCSSVIEYIEDDDALLRALAAALRPGGFLLISAPYSASVTGHVEDWFRRFRSYMSMAGRKHLSFSLRRYSRRGFVAMLDRVGFENFSCTHFELPGAGALGVPLSRLRFLGVMMLVVARKAASAGRANAPAKRPRSRALSRKNLWESTPPALKRIIGAPLSLMSPESLLGPIFRRTRKLVLAAETWTADQIREYQFAEAQRVLLLAYERSPFYRREFDAAGVTPRDLRRLEDLRGLPIIDREKVRANLDEMLTVSPTARNIDYVSTAGTSGAPLSFYINSQRSGAEYAYLISGWERAGFRLGTPLVVLRGHVVQQEATGLRHEYDPILRSHYYSTFHMGDDDLRRYLNHLRTVGPCYLHVYPSSVAILARFLRRSGEPAPENVRGIIAESEIIYPEQREMVQAVFGKRYFSSYGHTEKVIAASECEKSDDYHVWPTYGLFELLDEQGRPVTTPGQRGELVGTGFINTVTPFIRYRTGDWAMYVGDHCEHCGRRCMVIRDIRGHRTQETLVAADGSLVPWTAINMHDDTFVNVQRFQFFQERPGVAELRIVPSPGFGDADAARIRDNLAKKLNGRIAIEIKPGAIEQPARGKATYVIQRIPNVESLTH